MKFLLRSLGLLLFVIVVAGCAGGNNTPAAAVTGGDSYVSPVLETGYSDALTARNQLALGLYYLNGTESEVTPEQASTLLPLWQALRGTTRSGAASTTEVNALLAQIEETLTPAQMETITEMRLTQDDLRTWAESQGLVLGNGTGTGGMGGGGGQGLSDEERLTRQAENGGTGTGGGGLNTALLDEIIMYLETR